ncbi:MAG: glycosyltransferase [Candidatus Nanoarchaeia archaeon]|nr:glycosyltransferase [Candidatus Nanoarchaeia archaeon]MDD5239279.1 glycosyltransferase [Candidatus Nanoarchaeia archaeon]
MFTIIMPAYNREASLEESAVKVSACLQKNYRNGWQMIIADCGSTDKTTTVARRLARTNKRMKAVCEASMAKSFRKCTKFLKGDAVVIKPELANNAEQIKTIIKLFSDRTSGPDIVNGSRFVKGARYPSFARKLICGFYNLFVRLVFKTKKLDYQCGLNGFREKVFRHLCVATKTEGMLWLTEALIRAARMEYDIAQIPVDYEHRWRINPGALTKTFRELFEIKRSVRL